MLGLQEGVGVKGCRLHVLKERDKTQELRYPKYHDWIIECPSGLEVSRPFVLAKLHHQ